LISLGDAIHTGVTISSEGNDFFPDKNYFEQNVSGLGSASASIGVAGLAVGFNGLTEDLIQQVDSLYGPFLTHDKALHWGLVCEGVPQYLEADPENMIRLRERVFHDGGLSLVSTDFAAYRNGNTGKLFVSNPNDLKQTTRGLENYMRWVMAELAIEQTGFILHSAGLIRNGKAYLFFGPSGAGKSTIAGLSNLPILSDDMVLVKHDGSRFCAYTTPFFGSFPQVHKHTAGYPVAGLFYLHKSDTVSVQAIQKPEAIGLLVSMCPFLSGIPRLLDRLLAIADRFCGSVPASRLYFKKDASFWQEID
jgi:hypothetical protein